MRRTLRAAALTAVAIAFVTAGGLAGPTIAAQGDAAPAITYTEHAAQRADRRGARPQRPPGSGPVRRRAGAGRDPRHRPRRAAGHLRRARRRPTRPRSLAELVGDYSGTETPDEETECLARAVYWESKGEPLHGQLTVAEVIINRSESGRFASTICGVVRQRGQFSFVRGGHIPQPPQASRDWRTAVAIAQIASQDLADGAAPRALFFHARHARPGWRLTRVATVGNHVFYR